MSDSRCLASFARRPVALLMAQTLVLVLLLFGLSSSAVASEPPAAPYVAAIDALQALGARVTLGADGNARFVRFPNGGWTAPPDATTDEARAAVFWQQHGAAFGVSDAATELAPPQRLGDENGGAGNHGDRTLVFAQRHGGVPVLAADLRLHFDAENNVRAANGYFAPALQLDVTPQLDVQHAASLAIAAVAADQPAVELSVRGQQLAVRHDSFFGPTSSARTPAVDQLVYRIEVVDGPTSGQIREFVSIDAHTGSVVVRESGIHDISRVLVESRRTGPGLFAWFTLWGEGDPATGVVEHDTIVTGNADIHTMVDWISGGRYIGFDGADGFMINVLGTEFYELSSSPCPNAWWNGSWVSFCPGMGTDDIVAHEWGHAYTEYTHGLTYRNQSGALNEAYSDIFGELADQVNGVGTDTPGTKRADGACTEHTVEIPAVTVPSHASLGDYLAGSANFGAQLDPTGVRGFVELVDDGSAMPSEGCGSLLGFTSGRIAMIDRGSCPFDQKVLEAQNAGAVAAVVCNNTAGGLTTMAAGAFASSVTIPSVFMLRDDCDDMKSASGRVEVELTDALREPSYRWLIAEDSSLGAFRDMWNPHCLLMPGKASDDTYFCGSEDNGGVHTNSGVPNHAFALLADGGTYNSVTVPAIGSARAAAIYWRAMTRYQSPSTDFSDHADALDQSCSDLIGTKVGPVQTHKMFALHRDYWPKIRSTDCDAVDAAMKAVEMRAPVC